MPIGSVRLICFLAGGSEGNVEGEDGIRMSAGIVQLHGNDFRSG